MLNFEFDGEKILKLEIVGSLQDALIETSFMINVIYLRIKKANSIAGAVFKNRLTQAFKDGIMFMDDDEQKELFKEKYKKQEDIEKEVKDFLKSLKRSKKDD